MVIPLRQRCRRCRVVRQRDVKRHGMLSRF
jgi:hypothetical protein